MLRTSERSKSFHYDNNGNLLSVADSALNNGNPLYQYTYDALNRVLQTTTGYLSNVRITNEYDRFGNRRKLELRDGSVSQYQYHYDNLNQLTTATLPGNQIYQKTCHQDTGLLKHIQFPSGISTNVSYTNSGNIAQLLTKNSSDTILEQRHYGYNDRQNISSLNSVRENQQKIFSYDNLDHLTQVESGETTLESFSYDLVGNRTNEGYSYNNNHQIQSSPTIEQYQFDENGNLKNTGSATYTHNIDNRLVEYSEGDTTATYQYDPFGRRINKTVNETTTWFVWDDSTLLAEYNGTNQRTKRYGYLNDINPIQMTDSSATYDVHYDHLGTPQFLTDAEQNIVWQQSMSAFGESTITGDIEFNFRFPGQYYDEESGLHYNYFRDYDPELGRYIQSDPIGLAGGINTYGYANQNPIIYVDPTGELGVFGAFAGAGLNLALQLFNNGGNLDCVSWSQVGAAGALGAVGGGWMAGAFKHAKSGKSWFKMSHKWKNVSPRVRRAQGTPKGNDLHHWAIARNGKVGKYVPDSIKNHPWNTNSIPRNVHRNIHGKGVEDYSAFGRWWHGTPGWAKAGQGSLATGFGADAAAGGCGCGN